jgi:hypothetical protein
MDALGLGVSLMIVFVGIDQGRASRRVTVTVRSERFRPSGEFDGAETSSSLAPGGYDEWPARG